MKFIIGTKQNMAQVFDESGKVNPVTVVATGANTVTYVKTKEKDGYSAFQVGYGTRHAKNVSKSVKGHLKDLGSFRVLKEFRIKGDEVPAVNVGDKIEPTTFAVGDVVRVTATSKGKGFQGVVKRHGFHGGPRSHGQKHSEREPGSISHGLRTGPRRGLRMAGRMGSDTVTVKNLKIVDVQADHILVKGAIPGRRGTIVEIRG